MARRIEWDEGALQELLRGPSGPVVRDLLPRIGQIVLNGAVARCPVLTGETKASLHYYIEYAGTTPRVVVAGSDVIYYLAKAGQMHHHHHPLTDALQDVRGSL